MTASPRWTAALHRACAFGVAAVLLLALTGCSDALFGGGALSGGSTSADPTPSPDAPGGAEADADDEEPVAKTLTGAECIVGTWLLDNASFAAELTRLATDGYIVDDVSGIVRFRADADGSAVTEYVDWTHKARVEGQAGVVTLIRNGEDLGAYSVEPGGAISLAEKSNNSEIVATVTAGGNTITLPSAPKAQGALHSGVFTCHGDELSLTADGGSTILRREL